MSEMPDVKVLVESGCQLGEGPLWVPETSTLYWVDIVGHKLWSWSEAGGVKTVNTVAPVGGLARATGGRLVVSVFRGFAYLDPETGALEAIGDPTISPRRALMNDCKCDRKGRLMAGSRHPAEREAVGRGYLLDKGEIRSVPGEYIVWNGPAFSPAGDRVYIANSGTRKIFTASYDLESGEVGPMEVFVETKGDEGYPDGMTVDAQGRVWSARWLGWCVAVHNPDGSLYKEVKLPVPQVASITFGGADNKTAFVTTARTRMSSEALEQAPLSGHLFTFDVDEPGLEEPVYQD